VDVALSQSNTEDQSPPYREKNINNHGTPALRQQQNINNHGTPALRQQQNINNHGTPVLRQQLNKKCSTALDAAELAPAVFRTPFQAWLAKNITSK
jgi:hypothetical protein